MRRIVKLTAPLVALLVAATAAVAMADPVNSTDPYPRIDDPGGDACLTEAGAADRLVIQYESAKEAYDDAMRDLRAGVGAPDLVAAAEAPLLDLSVRLNTAKYALALCRNKEGRAEAKDKKCAALYLAYNQQLDELAIRVEQEKLAQAVLARANAAAGAGVVGNPELRAARLAAKLAEHDRKQAQRAADAALRKIRADADCKDGSFQRPQQAPPPREVVPTSAPADPPTEVTSAPAPTEGTGAPPIELTSVTSAPVLSRAEESARLSLVPTP